MLTVMFWREDRQKMGYIQSFFRDLSWLFFSKKARLPLTLNHSTMNVEPDYPVSAAENPCRDKSFTGHIQYFFQSTEIDSLA